MDQIAAEDAANLHIPMFDDDEKHEAHEANTNESKHGESLSCVIPAIHTPPGLVPTIVAEHDTACS